MVHFLLSTPFLSENGYDEKRTSRTVMARLSLSDLVGVAGATSMEVRIAPAKLANESFRARHYEQSSLLNPPPAAPKGEGSERWVFEEVSSPSVRALVAVRLSPSLSLIPREWL